ncbi:MAG: alpha/beta hydrolase [Coriobacteriales bacterium]|nr:alpha/beta hydrolase [Coriobacteriales bacterium]
MKKSDCVKLGNTNMQFVAFGKGSKKLVVLPGLSDGLATVKGKARILSVPYKNFLKEYTVYMFSRKDDMPDGYSIRDMADDQAAAMRSLGLEKACVLGVSQGGMIAQCMAIDHPELVEKLVLAVTAPNANEIVTSAVTEWIGMASRGEHTALILDTAEKTYSNEYLEKNRKYFPALAKLTKPSSYDRFMINAEAILDFDVRSELPKIGCPTLIIAGSDDKTVGTDAAGELNRSIKGSELYVYEGLGHGLYEEASDFYSKVFEFCNR